MYIGTCVPWMAIETKFSKLCIIRSLEEHLCAQLTNEIKTELASENIDKGKSILGAPPKLEKKDVKNPRAKKANFQKPKKKKQHLCHHCGATGHTQPNCYKWLATQ